MGMDSVKVATPTIGVDFYKKTIERSESGQLKVQFWDTAGQEKYRSMSIMHTRGDGHLLQMPMRSS